MTQIFHSLLKSLDLDINARTKASYNLIGNKNFKVKINLKTFS